MATPGTPSGENHSAESQKCGVKLVRPRASSSRWSSAIRGSSALPSMVTPSWQIRRSSSRSSGHVDHSSAGTTAGRDGAPLSFGWSVGIRSQCTRTGRDRVEMAAPGACLQRQGGVIYAAASARVRRRGAVE